MANPEATESPFPSSVLAKGIWEELCRVSDGSQFHIILDRHPLMAPGELGLLFNLRFKVGSWNIKCDGGAVIIESVFGQSISLLIALDAYMARGPTETKALARVKNISMNISDRLV